LAIDRYPSLQTWLVDHKEWKRKLIPSVQRVKKIPEKQIAAIPMKKMKSDIMARSDLEEK